MLGLLQHLVAFAAQVGLTSLYAGQRFNLFVEHQGNLLSVQAQLLEYKVGDLFANFHYALKQMHRFDGLLTMTLGQVHRLLHGFLRFDGVIVEIHTCYLLSSLFGF